MPPRSTGPQPADVLIVGEAFGKEEDALGVPFIGSSGQELRRMLTEAGFAPGNRKPFYDDSSIRFTNVFMFRPKDNKIGSLCGKRAEVGKDYNLLPLAAGQYVLPHFAVPALNALREEIELTRPRLIIALGNTAAWALVGRVGISKLRGSIFPNGLVDGGPPVLPTFHPANILRDWSNRVIALGDLNKAQRWLRGEVKIPRRELWLAPTLEEVRQFCTRYILNRPRPPWLSFDIETFGETITCIGFAPDPGRAITIPFYDPDKPDRNYWATAGEELAAWKICHAVLTSDIPKLGQNGLYDIQYLLRYRIQVRRYLRDTMIRHHSLHPELEKGLGFMGTLYTDEAPWKLLRDRKKDVMLKSDDE